MDISMFRDRTHDFKNLLATITIFKKNSILSNTNPETLKLARGMGLLLLAMLFAWIGKTETENTTRVKALNSEWPNIQVWRAILKQGNWVQLEKSDFSALLKNHPDPFSSQPMIWESEDHCYIFLTRSPYQSDQSEPELWSCATGQKKINSKAKWHQIGSGYAGADQLAKIIVPIVKKTVSYIDPKEIRY